MKHQEDLPVTKLLPTSVGKRRISGEGLPHAIYYSQVVGKGRGCEKSKGDMVKND